VLYRSVECVWKVKAEDYSDRVVKDGASRIIATSGRKMGKDSNCHTVVKKKKWADNLRIAFLLDRKKNTAT
jgi:hypothetical protein